MNSTVLEYEKKVEKLHTCLEKVLYFSGESSKADFLISSLIDYSPVSDFNETEQWLKNFNENQYFFVEEVPLPDLRNWNINPTSGDISHSSGGFFSIRGLSVKTNIGPIAEWTQPIIDQPEVGVLGIITKKINGVLHFLMQAKAEPGNINTFQLSPTVQATRSNFMGLHGGKSIRYIEYFLQEGKAQVIIDQLQSEQGARFYRKRNRNIIVRVKDDEDIALGENFRWVTLGQIKSLLLQDNLVNMDSRSVISSISFIPDAINSLKPVVESDLVDCLLSSEIVSTRINEIDAKFILSAHYNTYSLHNTDELIHKITENKFDARLDVNLVPMNTIKDWVITQDEIFHKEKRFFSILGVRIRAEGREVFEWDQPIVKQMEPGLTGFIASEINGIMHFLVQLKVESGNMDLVELAPTVQCITGSYRGNEGLPPYTNEMVASDTHIVVRDSLQSEEGGRFYREENRNMLLIDKTPIKESESGRYVWMTLKQLKNFVRYNNYLNIESRSLLSLI